MLGAAGAATAPSSIWLPPPSGCLLHLAASSIWQPPAGPRPTVSHAASRCRRLLPSAVADPQQQQQGQQQQQQQQPAPVYLQDGRSLALMTAFREKLGGKKNKLKPAEFAGLRGMALDAPTPAVAEGEILCSIPRSSTIRVLPKQPCPFPDWVQGGYWGRAPWYVQMALQLLREKELGAASRLAAYVDQLPPSFPEIPINWAPAQLQALQCPHLISMVEAQRAQFDTQYRELCSQGLQPGARPVSEQEFQWALCAVRSRTFSGPYIGSTLNDRLKVAGLVGALALANTVFGLADPQRTASAAVAVFIFNIVYEVLLSQSLKQYAMCPVIDFCNHLTASKSEVSFDYFLDSITVAASKPYKKGEQVYVSYGTQGNDSLVQLYGFAEQDNPADEYNLTRMMQWLESAGVQPSKARLDALQGTGLLPLLELVPIARTGVPASTLQALRFLLAPDANAARGPAAFEAAGSPELEARLGQVLVHVCNSELQALGTTLAEDQAMVATPKAVRRLTPQDRVACLYRIEKKRVLMACLKALAE